MTQVFQIRAPGEAVRFAAIYTPENPTLPDRNRGGRFMIVLDADRCVCPPQIVEFVRKNQLRASSGFRPRVGTFGSRSVPDLVQAIAAYDATNVGRDKLIRDCRELIAHVQPYAFRYVNNNNPPYEGVALSLQHIELDW